MELHHHNISVYVGGDPPEYPGASGHATDEFLAQVCSQDIMFLWEQGGDVHIRAACARIHSGMGDTTAFDGKEDSERKWYVDIFPISMSSDKECLYS
jgi:hypothetical protein